MIARLPAAVICDMDGLLVDSERLERRVWQAAAADHAIALDDARFASFVGHPAEVCDRMLRDYYGETFDVPAFRATCHGRMRALVASAGVSLRPGARAWLDFVRARGIPLGLATSSGPALVPERLGDLVALFSAVVTRADVARGKPHPDLYLEAAARLRVAPEAALAFEDSPTGARAALAAGMPVIIVPDLVPAPPDVAARAVGVFDSLDAVREAAARAWDGAARVAMRGLAGVLAATAIAAAAPRRTRAQMPEHDAPMAPGMSTGMQAMMTGPLGLPMTRTGSGTSWVPDSTPMYARMFDAGSWGLMFHGVAFGQYDHQGGPRGASQVGSVNWGMLMAAHNLGRATADGGGTGGRLELRGMLSLEPFTVGARGYPLLLQTGEAYHGRPLHDRQHPHDLFMELAALYERPLAPDLGLQLYAAPVGEPALGPVAFPHRPSAAADPFATLGHHWEDATHISFGVLTAGLFTRVVKLEGSVFNGREPDDVRTNFDYRGRSLDSYAGRLSVNPSPFVSLSAAYGYLKSPEALRPDESQHRATLSALYGRPFRARGSASVSVLYGINREAGSRASPSGGVEGMLDLDGTNTVFTRVESSRKTGEELALPSGVATDAQAQFALGSLAAGYVREVVRGVGLLRGASLGVGGEATVNQVPASLVPVYGSRHPVGFAVYLRLRPSRMAMAMGGMMHDGMSMPMAAVTFVPAARR